MNFQTVEIPRVGARERAAEYLRAAKASRDPRERREFEEIARAYRIAARDDVALIALTPTIASGGTVVRTRVFNRGTDREIRHHYLLPRLAVCRPSAAFCYTLGIQRNGAIEFIDSLGRDHRYMKGRHRITAGTFELPDGFEPGTDIQWTRSAWSAMVPIVPPQHRPPRGFGDRIILWEVENWEWSRLPLPPGDPALLRHVGGDIYAVEAVWDLTELERLVLSGRTAA
jgi:hypothetical protein